MINTILNKYIDNEKFLNFSNYSLADITGLLNLLGNPHKRFKSIHIAGTNGKGSTAFMLAEIIKNAGYKTGLYTSPHLVNVNERIKINSVDINDDRLYEYINRIDNLLNDNTDIHPTYFDLMTATAFNYFVDESVDIAIIETGLGGRLDSTNVISPEVAIITDISIDHVNILGNNLIDITNEKCGIIKKNIPVITSNTESTVLEIIKNYSNKNKSVIYSYGDDFTVENIRYSEKVFYFDYKSFYLELNNIKLPLFPSHQIKNAAVVIEALVLLRDTGVIDISDEIIYRVLSDIVIPGRFQILNKEPLIIYDPAHNFNALSKLTNEINLYYPAENKTYIISMMKDKADIKTLNIFKDLNVIYFLIDDKRAYIPKAGVFNIKTSENNFLIDIIKNSDRNKNIFIFTGTFRNYSNAIEIVKKLSE